MARLMKPISAALWSMVAKLFGIAPSSAQVPFPFSVLGSMPSRVCTCFEKMMIPMAANMPWIAELGTKEENLPSFMSPNRICTAPATTMAPSASCQPMVPPPNSATASAQITMRPAAGPLIVSLEPAKKLTTKPPIIAVSIP